MELEKEADQASRSILPSGINTHSLEITGPLDDDLARSPGPAHEVAKPVRYPQGLTEAHSARDRVLHRIILSLEFVFCFGLLKSDLAGAPQD